MKQLESLVTMARNRAEKPVVAVVWPSDESTVTAVRRALDEKFIKAITVGCADNVEKELGSYIAAGQLTTVDAPDAPTAAATAVALVNEGKAQLIMKGLINTDVLLKAILNKECGLMEKGSVLTHVTIGDIPSYDKLLLFTDPAVLPFPNAEQREAQLRYLLNIGHRIGIECPRVSLIHCSEKVDERHFPYTAEYRELAGRAANGEFGKCIVDGPFDVKTSCNLHAAQVKGIDSPLEGHADALIFPDINSGNAFYKSMTLFAGMQTAAVLCGARVPVVVPSRGDSGDNKFYSLAAASLLAD